MQDNNEIVMVRKMLTALLRDRLHVVGGYVYGRTKNDDPFIILYPAQEYLTHKICRVYPHDFKKLPKFIPTDNVPGDTENNPDKGAAIKYGIYHTCPVFQIVTYFGKETQMGPEVRFSDVLWVSSKAQKYEQEPQEEQPEEQADKVVETSSSNLVDSATVAEIHFAGIKLYGTNVWNTKIPSAARWASTGAVDSINELNQFEAEELLARLIKARAKEDNNAQA